MFHLQNYKTMKANVSISAVKKEFKNGQQGWQVFVEGMEGRIQCKMNFTSPLKAMRYCFVLSKRLELQINDIQLAALSLAYQRSKSVAAQALTAADATEVAQQVAQEEGAEDIQPAPELEESVVREEAAPNELHQWASLKVKHPDAVLLFRNGDFYEAYGADAEKAAEALGLTLTQWGKSSYMMCGFPFHALDTYLPRLVRSGHRVAICDQLEAPKPKAKRGITELVEPGVH